MTTGRRITISQQTVLMALAEMKARTDALPEPQRAQRMAEMAYATPGEYAAALAPYFFTVLERHVEETT